MDSLAVHNDGVPLDGYRAVRTDIQTAGAYLQGDPLISVQPEPPVLFLDDARGRLAGGAQATDNDGAFW